MACNDDRFRQSGKWGIPRWDIPPWELPGDIRFDSQPHRGPLLRRLANVAFVCSVLSYFPLFGCPYFIFYVFYVDESWITLFWAASIVGLLSACLGLEVWMLARGDLEEMRTGLNDPEAKSETKFGRDRALDGFILGLGSFLLWSLPALFALLGKS